jgi:hypothetical protein
MPKRVRHPHHGVVKRMLGERAGYATHLELDRMSIFSLRVTSPAFFSTGVALRFS